MRRLARLGRFAPVALAGGIFAGLLVPQAANLLAPLLLPSIVVLLVLALLRIEWGVLGRRARDVRLVALVLAWLLAAAPVLAWILGLAANLPPPLLIAVVLGAAASPIMSSPTFAQIVGLDAPLSVVTVVATTLLLPLSLPPLASWLLDLPLVIAADAFAGRVVLFIVLPFALALVVRRMTPPGRLPAAAPALDGVNVIVLLVFAVAVMDGVTARLLAEPGTVLLFTLAAFASNIGFQVLGTLLFWRYGQRIALTVGQVSGNRNTSLILALAGGVAGPDFLLFVAVAQIPIFLLPFLARPVYRRILAGA